MSLQQQVLSDLYTHTHTHTHTHTIDNDNIFVDAIWKI
jgi:hypothetical protein